MKFEPRSMNSAEKDGFFHWGSANGLRALHAPTCLTPAIVAIAAHADRAALDLLLQLHNDSSERMRDTLSESIETLAGRLGLTGRR